MIPQHTGHRGPNKARLSGDQGILSTRSADAPPIIEKGKPA
jgi:hypothetical protein